MPHYVYIKRTQNTAVIWIIRLMSSLLCRPKVILKSGWRCIMSHNLLQLKWNLMQKLLTKTECGNSALKSSFCVTSFQVDSRKKEFEKESKSWSAIKTNDLLRLTDIHKQKLNLSTGSKKIQKIKSFTKIFVAIFFQP